MPSQAFLFTQHLTVDHPYSGNHINQQNPIWEHQELAQQDRRERHINGIATKSKNAGRYKFVRVLLIDANAETLPKGNQT